MLQSAKSHVLNLSLHSNKAATAKDSGHDASQTSTQSLNASANPRTASIATPIAPTTPPGKGQDPSPPALHLDDSKPQPGNTSPDSSLQTPDKRTSTAPVSAAQPSAKETVAATPSAQPSTAPAAAQPSAEETVPPTPSTQPSTALSEEADVTTQAEQPAVAAAEKPTPAPSTEDEQRESSVSSEQAQILLGYLNQGEPIYLSQHAQREAGLPSDYQTTVPADDQRRLDLDKLVQRIQEQGELEIVNQEVEVSKLVLETLLRTKVWSWTRMHYFRIRLLDSQDRWINDALIAENSDEQKKLGAEWGTAPVKFFGERLPRVRWYM